ncbi:MAG: DUF6494 family protein [Vulcanimicrobiaceae bacterium]
MDEDKLNHTIRTFLKEVGVTSQRALEKAVRDGIAAGRLKGTEIFDAKMTLAVAGLDLTHEVVGKIELT